MPEVPGAGHAITSNEAFHLEELPKSIVIVGGGYIAVEFAGIFNGLGVDTTLLYRGPKILRGFDEELRDHLTEELFKRGIDVRVQCRHRRHRQGLVGATTVTLKDGSTVETGVVMFATGRSPNTKRARPGGRRREAGRARARSWSTPIRAPRSRTSTPSAT